MSRIAIVSLVALAGCVPAGAVRVQVFDEAGARALGDEIGQSTEAVGDRIVSAFNERLPHSPAGTSDVWGAVGGIAGLYIANQVRKWHLSRGKS
jgi:hypothetical protein